MARGDLYEQTGWLNEEGGHWSLRVDGGGRWRLDLGWRAHRRAKQLLGSRVRLIGLRDGFDVLAVTHVEAMEG